MMSFPEEHVISDGSLQRDYDVLGLPLAAVICIVIVIYGLLVLICIFVRQVILNRRPLATLESLHCCECLLFLPKPAFKCCDFPCGQPGKTEVTPCKLHFERLWAALPRCRLPESSGGASCWPTLPAVECPTSVRCCGLEIRRDTRPGMVDASVSSGDMLKSSAPGTPASRAAAGAVPRTVRHGSETGDTFIYTHRPGADSSPYSIRSAVLGTAESGDYSRHTADTGDYSRHTVESGDSSLHTAVSSSYSQHRAGVLDPAVLLKPAASAP